MSIPFGRCSSKQDTIEMLVEKLMGYSDFKGVSPVDAYCGFKDTYI